MNPRTLPLDSEVNLTNEAPQRTAIAGQENARLLIWLLKNRLSDNVGSVKHISSTPRRALGEERHFALVDGLPFQPRLACNLLGQELSPTHASLRSATGRS